MKQPVRTLFVNEGVIKSSHEEMPKKPKSWEPIEKFKANMVRVENQELLGESVWKYGEVVKDGFYDVTGKGLVMEVNEYCDRGSCIHGDAGCYAEGMYGERCWAKKKATLSFGEVETKSEGKTTLLTHRIDESYDTPEVKQQEAPDSVCAKCGGKGFYQYNSTDEKTPCSCRSNNWEFLYNLVKEENEAKGKKLHELEKAYNKLGVQFDREMTRLQERSMDDLNRIKDLEEENTRLKGMLLKASYLVGNPATGISSSTDIAAENWQKEYEQLNKTI